MAKTAISLSIAFLLLLTSCGGHESSNKQSEEVGDSLFMVLATSSDTARVLFLTDSLVNVGDLSVWGAAIVRCEVYRPDDKDHSKRLEILRDAVKHKHFENYVDSLSYYYCVAQLANQLLTLNRIEESLKIALEGIEPLDKLTDNDRENKYANYNLLQNFYEIVSQSQSILGMDKEADRSYEEAFRYPVLSAEDGTEYLLGNAIVFTYNTILRCHEKEEFAKAEKWLHRQDSLTKVALASDAVSDGGKDYFKALYAYNHALNALGLDKKDEAEQAFNDYQQTQFATTEEGRLDGADYLQKTGRLVEAADAVESLEKFYADNGMELSLDLLSKLGEKFRLNYKIGRKEAALATANYVFENLDSVIKRQKESNVAEMATVYETNKKDAEIAQQQIELTQQRVIGLIIAIILLTIFFIIYTLVRRRAAKRLAEMKAAQERIESELRIARDIQMSMVPSSFPDYEGLDMFASMTPAKEVGGDLYGYVLLGDKLYFALGDVSGKGVPASLFMAQATRLFRTLAVQQMKPAEIWTRMSNALSGEENESGMFVTFWLGLVDLTTGHLDFCNAGHNPPVIDGGESNGEFLDMIPNAPIGLFPGLDYEGEEIDNVKGRQLFIYTDGLNEAENKAQEQFGDDRLLEILRTSHFDSAQQVIDALKAEVEQHRNGAEPNDDLTMMCIRIAECPLGL